MTNRPGIPQDFKTEQEFLGSILMDGKRIRDVEDLPEPSDFYDAKHAPIFAAMLALDDKDEPITLITVGAQMRKAGTIEQLAMVGHEAYLSDLAIRGSHGPVASYAKIIREHSDRRQLMLLGERLTDRAARDDVDFPTLYDTASKDLLAIGMRTTGDDVQTMRQLVPNAIQEFRRRQGLKMTVTGVPSGFAVLDRMTAGFQPQDLIIVGARASMGKSAFAMQIAMQAAAADPKARALVMSLEMSKEALTERLIAVHGGIDLRRLRTGQLSPEDWSAVTKTHGELIDRAISICDTGGLTLAQIRAKARRWRSTFSEGPGIVIIDYLQLVGSAAGTRGQSTNREQEVATISKGLKALAKELKVPVVALSQLSRELEKRTNKRPILSDLRESGAIEQDADVVIFLHRDDYYDKTKNPGVAEIIIGKQRNGETGTVLLGWNACFTRFVPLAPFYRSAP